MTAAVTDLPTSNPSAPTQPEQDTAHNFQPPSGDMPRVPYLSVSLDDGDTTWTIGAMLHSPDLTDAELADTMLDSVYAIAGLGGASKYAAVQRAIALRAGTPALPAPAAAAELEQPHAPAEHDPELESAQPAPADPEPDTEVDTEVDTAAQPEAEPVKARGPRRLDRRDRGEVSDA